MPKPAKDRESTGRRSPAVAGQAIQLRIIGGQWRGRRLRYSGDPLTRPMKDNTREAVFNLIGGWLPGKLTIDLFAGTGAIGLEAISRGAERAILVEHHFQTAKIIEQNVRDLDASARASVVMSDTFFWARQFLKESHAATPPWAVFCSPPYDLYSDRPAEMQQLIHSLWNAAPRDSVFVVEADVRFDANSLPEAARWRVHEYHPAVVYVWRPTAGG